MRPFYFDVNGVLSSPFPPRAARSPHRAMPAHGNTFVFRFAQSRAPLGVYRASCVFCVPLRSQTPCVFLIKLQCVVCRPHNAAPPLPFPPPPPFTLPSPLLAQCLLFPPTCQTQCHVSACSLCQIFAGGTASSGVAESQALMIAGGERRKESSRERGGGER